MIEVHGAARTIHYDGFQVSVLKDKTTGHATLAFYHQPTGTAHVFPLPEQVAKVVEDGLTAIRSGVVVAAPDELPGQNGSEP